MKKITLLIIAQLAITAFLVFKIYSLETQIQQVNFSSNLVSTKQAATHSQNEKTDALYYDPGSSLSLDEIRTVIQEELSNANRANVNENKQVTHYQQSASPEKFEALLSQLDYYFTDGDFSAVEMSNFESELAKLNQQDRQLLLNKMAKAMSKANVNFTH